MIAVLALLSQYTEPFSIFYKNVLNFLIRKLPTKWPFVHVSLHMTFGISRLKLSLHQTISNSL